MKTSAMSLALVALVASVNAACADAVHDDDVDSALEAFRHPTGTFSKENGSSAFSNYRSEQSESSKVNTPKSGESSGTSSSQSVRLLAKTVDSQAKCSEGQSCPCDAGGSFVYSQLQRSEGLALRFKFDDCLSADKTGFAGEAVLFMTDKALLGDDAARSSSSSSSSSSSGAPKKTGSLFGNSKPLAMPSTEPKNMFLAARGNAIEGSKRTPIEFALIKEGEFVLLAVEVPDGKIVIGIASDRSAFVKAKQGTFLCQPKGKEGYACKSTNGGEELDVDADTASSAGSDAKDTGYAGTGSADSGDEDTYDEDTYDEDNGYDR
jgi:hypothetical protein